MAGKDLSKLLTRLSQEGGALGNYARSILSHDGFKIQSHSADEVAEPEGSTDPFAYDPNVEALLASGIISAEEKEDPIALVIKLSSVLIGMRNAVTQDAERAEVSSLNQTEVQSFDNYYREKLRGVAQAEIVYDDPLLFQNLKPEEAAGLARALIAVTKVTRPLWVEISNTGRGK